VAWQTVDGELSTTLGSELHEEQMRIHRSSGRAEAPAEAETKKQNSFYCLCHLDGKYFPRGKGSTKNGVCEGAVMRTDIGTPPPPPPDKEMPPPACRTCAILQKKKSTLPWDSARVCNARGVLLQVQLQTSESKSTNFGI
jgi:hypothetical protein